MNGKNLIFDDNSVFKDYYLENGEKSLEYLPKINTINILIGANNSGKSSLMRKIMTQNKYDFISDKLYYEYNKTIDNFNKEARTKFSSYNKSYELVNLKLNKEIRKTFLENENKLSNNRFGIEGIYSVIFGKFENIFFEHINNSKKYYIPTLRSAHSLFENSQETGKKNKIQQDIFKQTLKKSYQTLGDEIDIFTGLDLYEQILDSRNSDKRTRDKFEDFEKFLSKNFFSGKRIDIVAEFKYKENIKGKNESELILIHVEAENETRKLYELGDGVQAIIILMYKIFMAEDNSFFFIDEPELNLHPGMQRLFLEQIISNEDLKKKNLTYFITTHSNHFLDLTIEKDNVSIYSFSPRVLESGEKQFVIKNVNAGDNEVLRNLGVNNSSVFMANCSIWVEGISDRNYIKSFLKSYCDYHEDKPYPKEDIDFAFFEYAGSNYTHYNFYEDVEESKIKAFALTNKILFISDLDKGKEEKHDKLTEIAKDNFEYKTTSPYREMENLFSNKIWKKVLIEFRNKKEHKKISNEDIQEKINISLTKLKSEDYKDKYIGEFLKKIKIEELNKIYDGSESKPTAFKYKAQLSNTILEKVNNKEITWEDFNSNRIIVELTESIYNFITDKK